MNFRVVVFALTLISVFSFVNAVHVSIADKVEKVCDEVKGFCELLKTMKIDKKNILEIFRPLKYNFILIKINQNDEVEKYYIQLIESDGYKIATRIIFVGQYCQGAY